MQRDTDQETFDYVVVGAGSAGCVLANRLSADGRTTVCLLEAGPSDRSLWVQLPIGYGKTMFDPAYNWRFYTEPEPGMNQRRIYWPRGRGLGGSSSINGLIFVRGQPQDYDQWAATGNAGWGWDDVLPFFNRAEGNDRLGPPWHGGAGPLTISSLTERNELVESFIAGANALGIPRTEDFNGLDQHGVGYYQLNTRNGWRCSTAKAYLRPARQHAGLSVQCNAQASRVVIEQGVARAVEYQQHGRRRLVHARREVILSAGALQSPQLLQLSGIGPPALLRQFGISVTHALAGVGENLQDHLQMRLIFECLRPITTNDQLRSLWGRLRMGLQFALFRRGPLAIGINQGGLFSTALPTHENRPDTQFHFATLSADMAGGKVHDFSGFTMSVCQLRPRSRGQVRIQSPDPQVAPAMQPRYLSDEVDRLAAVAAVKLARAIAATPPMRAMIAREHRPGPEVETDAGLLEFCRAAGATIFHPVGTCRMGSDPLAVVDARLRVHGVGGLRVVDGSIMPTLVSGNTNFPIVMIAEKASDMIREDANP